MKKKSKRRKKKNFFSFILHRFRLNRISKVCQQNICIKWVKNIIYTNINWILILTYLKIVVVVELLIQNTTTTTRSSNALKLIYVSIFENYLF